MFKKYFKYTFLVIVLAFQASHLSAAHIVGGDLTYQCMSFDTTNTNIFVNIRIEFNLYRDQFSNGAQFTPAEIGIFQYNSSGNYIYIADQIEQIDEQGIVENTLEDDPCIIVPPMVGVERARYTFDVRLPLLTIPGEGYTIVYQRCCRNETIFNIVAPGEAGAAFSVDISSEAMQMLNDSPTFDNFPPVIICNGQDINFPHGATDPDGSNQIIYSFCAPLTAGGQDGANGGGDPQSCTGVTPNPQNCLPPFDEVVFQLPAYSAVSPMGSNITIDPFTGLISGIPNINGQYVVGICAEEIFNGQVISVIRRDFQFNVTDCDPFIEAVIAPSGGAQIVVIDDEEVIVSCGEPEITFVHDGSPDNIDNYTWFANVDGISQIKEGDTATFDFEDVGTYDIVLYTNFGSPCQEKDSLRVLIYDGLAADFTFDYDTCIAGPVFYEDQSILDGLANGQSIQGWEWDFAGMGTSDQQNPNFLFDSPGVHPVTLEITDNNNCTARLTKDIQWIPVPPLLIIQPSSFIGCAPADIFFNNLSSPIDSTYLIEWDFGDGETGDEISPTHQYTETGVYDVSVTVTSPNNCTTSRDFSSWIKIEEKPTADFTFSPEEPNVFNTEVDFFDNSIGAVAWQWDFSGESVANEPNPTYTFQDTGMYLVSLTVRHPSGCTDTLTRVIDIEPIVRFHMPNAFTPNGDATNDILKGNGYYEGMTDFSYTIWNRWGEQIFSTDDPFTGWNGRKNNTGQDSPTGVYVYDIKFVDPRGKMQSLRGHATLIR